MKKKRKKSTLYSLKKPHVCRGTPCIQRFRFRISFRTLEAFQTRNTREKSIQIVRDLNLERIQNSRRFRFFKEICSSIWSFIYFLCGKSFMEKRGTGNALFFFSKCDTSFIFTFCSLPCVYTFRSHICTDTIFQLEILYFFWYERYEREWECVCMCAWRKSALDKYIHKYSDESVTILWNWSVKIQSLLYLTTLSFFSLC